MKRRAFIAGLGAAAWLFAARAQQVSSLPLIGCLGAGSPDPFLCACPAASAA